jgi:excinuclease UvrABC ATPase subunit
MKCIASRVHPAQPQERQHDIPRDSLVVITGVSGSASRRASTRPTPRASAAGVPSTYARQFIGQMDKPE